MIGKLLLYALTLLGAFYGTFAACCLRAAWKGRRESHEEQGRSAWQLAGTSSTSTPASRPLEDEAESRECRGVVQDDRRGSQERKNTLGPRNRFSSPSSAPAGGSRVDDWATRGRQRWMESPESLREGLTAASAHSSQPGREFPAGPFSSPERSA
jgi:hypothetical protein